MNSTKNKKILITGATDGIGALTVKIFAEQGAHLLIHGRDTQKVNSLAIQMRRKYDNNNIEEYTADLSELAQVRQLAGEVLENHNHLDVLINNAGVGFGNEFQASKDGYEMRMAVNYLAPFLLTHLLLPAIKNAAPSRIVNVSSAGQAPLNLEENIFAPQNNARHAYSQSKLALNMFTMELANQLKEENITVNSLHPGTFLNTKMVRVAEINPLGEAETGADALVYLATSPDLEHISGKYFDSKTEARPHNQAFDEEVRKKLWALSIKKTGLNRESVKNS